MLNIYYCIHLFIYFLLFLYGTASGIIPNSLIFNIFYIYLFFLSIFLTFFLFISLYLCMYVSLYLSVFLTIHLAIDLSIYLPSTSLDTLAVITIIFRALFLIGIHLGKPPGGDGER